MNSEPQGTSSRASDALEALDPDKLLLDLGWSEAPAARAAAGAVRSRPARHYCSFCWTAIPDGDEECDSCGRSLDEILAASAQGPAQAAGWVPTRLGGASTVKKSPRPVRVVALTTETTGVGPSLARIRRVLHPAATVLLVAGLLAASAWTGAYLGRLTVEKARPAEESGSLDRSPAPTPSPPAAPVQVEWQNTYSKLRLELVSRDGKVLAASDGAASTAFTVKPGDYRLRTSDKDGEWHPAERTITVRAGERLVLSPSPESVADFFTFRGSQLRNEGKQQEAMEAWRTAIQAQPTLPEPRLQVAEALISAARFAEAGIELRAVMDVSPDDPRALRLMRRIREQSSP